MTLGHKTLSWLKLADKRYTLDLAFFAAVDSSAPKKTGSKS